MKEKQKRMSSEALNEILNLHRDAREREYQERAIKLVNRICEKLAQGKFSIVKRGYRATGIEEVAAVRLWGRNLKNYNDDTLEQAATERGLTIQISEADDIPFSILCYVNNKGRQGER